MSTWLKTVTALSIYTSHHANPAVDSLRIIILYRALKAMKNGNGLLAGTRASYPRSGIIYFFIRIILYKSTGGAIRMDFRNCKTYVNVMRAFAGESQARNRYNIAASIARKEGLQIIEAIFNYTADQERAHAKVFYEFLKDASGENIAIEGACPVDLHDSTLKLLRAAQYNENEEWEDVYRNFGLVAKEEGFANIARTFENIAKIERVHAERFGRYADELENGTLFKKKEEIVWICTNCGHIHMGKEAPEVCNVCRHPRGFFIPFAESFAAR
jgi:rubrerythrin